jgi:hypothetical protein
MRQEPFPQTIAKPSRQLKKPSVTNEYYYVMDAIQNGGAVTASL